MSLADIAVGESATVESTGRDHKTFLRSQGIDDGTEITVLGFGVDGSALVQGPTGTMHLAGDVAANIFVARLS
jgi:hypothetical protein